MWSGDRERLDDGALIRIIVGRGWMRYVRLCRRVNRTPNVMHEIDKKGDAFVAIDNWSFRVRSKKHCSCCFVPWVELAVKTTVHELSNNLSAEKCDMAWANGSGFNANSNCFGVC